MDMGSEWTGKKVRQQLPDMQVVFPDGTLADAFLIKEMVPRGMMLESFGCLVVMIHGAELRTQRIAWARLSDILNEGISFPLPHSPASRSRPEGTRSDGRTPDGWSRGSEK
jgi:hypothetical protein